jgi:hypothetical protein
MVCDGKFFTTLTERLVIRQALPDSVVVVVTSLNIIFVGYDLGFKYASGVKNGSANSSSSATEPSIGLRLVANKTDNKYYYNDTGRIPMDGQLFTLDTDIIKDLDLGMRQV